MAAMAQLVIIGLQGKRDILKVPLNCSIDQLFAEVTRTCAPGVSADELRLVYGGSELERGTGKTIQSYDIPQMGQIFMVIRLRGGPYRIALPLAISSLICADAVTTTYDTDVITLDNDRYNSRLRMPCGHALGADSLLEYCTNLADAGHHLFPCPSCRSNWNFAFIRKALRQMGQTILSLDSKVAENSLKAIPGFQKCAGCKVWMYKDPNEKSMCVTCPLCRYSYCWSCFNTWLSFGSYCGNSSCQMGTDPRIRLLNAQPLKTIGVVSGCPSVRGCPKCGTLLQHREACKHMACKSCQFQFCFVCLKPYNVTTAQWQCGAHNAACPVAPCQTTLPE